MDQQKVKVSVEEIASHSFAPYVIYNSQGKILIRKGDLLNAKKLSYLSMTEMFRIANPDEIEGAKKFVSVMSKETTNIVISLTKNFLSAVEKGEKPSVQAFYMARDRIYKEVKDNIKNLNNIGDLRIYYEEYFFSHAINVSTMSAAIALRLGYEEDILRTITLGALLHDIGMTRIPRQILDKPDILAPKEYELVKLHTRLGYKIIREEYGMPHDIAVIALDHHERYDGSGYTRALQGDKINELAQIVMMADIYDASMSHKTYSPAKDPHKVIKELLKTSKCYNPKLLYAIIHMVDYNTGQVKGKTY